MVVNEDKLSVVLSEFARTAMSERFHHSALHDPLTGLPNRLLLQERVDHVAQRAKRVRTTAAILFVDLDRFKQVNDVHGHQVGDELLVAVAHRLSGLVRSGDTLARFAGDEFVFLCEDLNSVADVEVLASRIGQVLAEPFVLAGTELPMTVSASVGIAFAGPGEDISDELVLKADMAMYQAKRNGGGCHRIVDMRETLQSEHGSTLERDLRSALVYDQLDVAYQPIVRSCGRAPVRGGGAAALDAPRSRSRPGADDRGSRGAERLDHRDRGVDPGAQLSRPWPMDARPPEACPWTWR